MSKKETNPFVLLDAAALSKLIKDIVAQRVKFADAVQTAAIQCIAQSIKHRNVTPANDLYEAVKGPTRRDTLLAYFEKFGQMAWSKAEKKIIFFDVEKMLNKPIAWTEEYAKEVAGTRWENVRKEPEPVSIFDVEQYARKFLNHVAKMLSDSGITVKHEELYTAMYEAYLTALSKATRESMKLMSPEEQAKEAGKIVETSGASKVQIERTEGGEPPSPEALAALKAKLETREPVPAVQS